MGIFNGGGVKDALSRKEEEFLFDLVAEELEQGHRERGLWLKATAEALGDETKVEAIYAKLRVQSLADDKALLNNAIEKMPQEKRPRSIPPAFRPNPLSRSITFYPFYWVGLIALVVLCTLALIENWDR